MKTRSQEEIIENSIKWGKNAAKRLGDKLIERAHKYEAEGVKTPINLMVIKTPFYEVQLNYIGKWFGEDTFTLLDTCDAYTEEPHGYPKTYFGDAEALIADIISEIEFIDTTHTHIQE